MKKKITIGEKYRPAMEIKTEEEAKVYFEKCVKHTMRFGVSRENAEVQERSNIGYFAGYYDTETRKRIEKLFLCEHPIFGSVEKDVTTDEAFLLGVKVASMALGKAE